MDELGFRRPSLLRRLLTRRRVRQLERLLWEHNQRFAWYVQEILAGCGLAQQDSSIAGGRTVHVPHVIAVIPGPPLSLDIRILPGQLPLAPSLIRLELVP